MPMRSHPIQRYMQARLLFLLLAGILFGLYCSNAAGAGKMGDAKPNIIIILVDDAGYADFGFMGCKDLQTRNIDQLAARAIKFTDAHVSASVCSPSRAGLLTGKYQQRFGYECNEGEGYVGVDIRQLLMPAMLQKNGYATAAFGKWHLGYEANRHPLERGFDYYYGFLSGGRSYFYRPDKDDKPGVHTALLENHTQVPFEGYLTDVLGNKAAEYIQTHTKQPFFMYWAPNAVHTPMEATEADMQQFKQHPRQKLAAMTFALDRAVGHIIETLKQTGLYDNTVIFFLSDNGGAHNNQSNNGTLKGFKGNEYEAGHRVPFLLSWPARFPQGRAYGGLTSSLDIYPTVYDAAGIRLTYSNDLDGVSLLPILEGKQKGQPHQQLIWRKDAAAALRYGTYKMVSYQGLGTVLYDLNKDPGETKDISKTQTNTFHVLQQKMQEWEKGMIKPLWTEGAEWDTITMMIHDDLMHNRLVRVKNPEALKEYRSKKNNASIQ